MNAKNKANEIFNSMFINQNNGNLKADTHFAKICALIAVDEILLIGWNLPHYENQDGKAYWQEVKKQIELL